MKFARIVIFMVMVLFCVIASRVQAVTGPTVVTHRELQAVNDSGVSTWTGSYPFTITGVILNNPEDMLNSTYVDNPTGMGAQWQMFIQGIDGDHCGTALWMGQNYDSLWQGVGTYPNVATQEYPVTWGDEMNRLNYNAADNHHFRQGDKVTVTVNASKFYGGKRNINEDHNATTTDNDFTITLVEADHGLPTADEITLSDLYVAPASAYPMFDQTRDTGAEYYQGTYVKLTGLTLTDDSGWGATAWADRTCTVTDDPNNPERTFTLRMPIPTELDLGETPTGEFAVYGIINQESGFSSNGRMGYELFVTSVVPEPAILSILLVGTWPCLKKRRRT